MQALKLVEVNWSDAQIHIGWHRIEHDNKGTVPMTHVGYLVEFTDDYISIAMGHKVFDGEDEWDNRLTIPRTWIVNFNVLQMAPLDVSDNAISTNLPTTWRIRGNAC